MVCTVFWWRLGGGPGRPGFSGLGYDIARSVGHAYRRILVREFCAWPRLSDSSTWQVKVYRTRCFGVLQRNSNDCLIVAYIIDLSYRLHWPRSIVCESEVICDQLFWEWQLQEKGWSEHRWTIEFIGIYFRELEGRLPPGGRCCPVGSRGTRLGLALVAFLGRQVNRQTPSRWGQPVPAPELEEPPNTTDLAKAPKPASRALSIDYKRAEIPAPDVQY